MPHWFDKPLRVQSMDGPWTDSGGVAGICMKMLPPSSCGMPLVTAAWCGFLRDGIEERAEVGMFPLPQRNTFPLPTGVDSRSIQCQGCASPHPVPGEKLPEDPVSSPCTAIRGYRQTLPAPSGGGGRRPRSGREVGVVYEYRSTIDTGDRGGRLFHPPPHQPLPHGGDIPSIRCHGGGRFLSVSPKAP